jgi:hypothetical protein
MNVLHEILLKNGDLSQAIATQGIDFSQLGMISIQAVYTGAPVGDLSIQVSDDVVPVGALGTGTNVDPAANVVNWTTIQETTVTLSAAGSFNWRDCAASYHWIRVIFTPSTGSTGSLLVSVTGKG